MLLLSKTKLSNVALSYTRLNTYFKNHALMRMLYPYFYLYLKTGIFTY